MKKKFILIGLSLLLSTCTKGGKSDENTIAMAGAMYAVVGLSDVNRTPEGEAIVKANESYLRLKLQDDPLDVPANNGLVHFVLDFEDISHYVYSDGSGKKLYDKEFESITLYLDSVEAIKTDGSSIVSTAQDSSITLFERDLRYARVLNRLPLPAGDYSELIVHLVGENGNNGNKPHTIKIGSSDIKLNFIKKRLSFHDSFRVEAGKLTTLNAKPSSDRVIHYQEKKEEYRSQMELASEGFTVTWPVEKIWINMKSISVTNQNGETIVLSDVATTFDLLSLRDTAVLLVGNQMVPAGTYTHFTIELNPENAIQVEGESRTLTIVNEYTTSFDIEGPFELRGGRISEIILDFNPNLSVYSTVESGYVLDPVISAVSVLSMTPAQDRRFIEALGDYANPVAREAEVVFEGNVRELNYILDKNIYNKDMIYQNIVLYVDDRLRGKIDNEDAFPLKVIGGTYNGVTLKVNHMPEFSKGEKVLLFLKEVNGRLAPVRGDMGKITLE